MTDEQLQLIAAAILDTVHRISKVTYSGSAEQLFEITRERWDGGYSEDDAQTALDMLARLGVVKRSTIPSTISFVSINYTLTIRKLQMGSNPALDPRKAAPLLVEYAQFGPAWLGQMWKEHFSTPQGSDTSIAAVEVAPSNTITTETSEPLITEDGAYIVSEAPVSGLDDEIPTIVSSETWTGIEKRLQRDSEAVDRIRHQLAGLDREVEKLGLTNRERAKVKAITEALVKLVESPEPEWKGIVELLRSPTLAAVLGLAGLVQLILKIIFGIG